MQQAPRIWIATLFGFAPLLVTLALETAIGLAAPMLLVLTLASIVLGLAIVLVIMGRKSQETAATARSSRPGRGAPLDLRESGTRDPLTGLPTFQPFSERLLIEYQHVQDGGGQVAVVLADISQLAVINDEFGAEVGDDALKLVSECLTRNKRANDIVARAGDDEFALLLPDCDRQGAERFIARAQSWLKEEPLVTSRGGKNYTLWIGLCAGYAECDDDGNGPDEALSIAIDSLSASREERDLQQSRWSTAA